MNVLRAVVASLTLFAVAFPATAAPLNFGSKRFTESYILAEIIKQAAEATGATEVSHRQGLGNTAILLSALKTGSIDIYPEYTGDGAFLFNTTSGALHSTAARSAGEWAPCWSGLPFNSLGDSN